MHREHTHQEQEEQKKADSVLKDLEQLYRVVISHVREAISLARVVISSVRAVTNSVLVQAVISHDIIMVAIRKVAISHVRVVTNHVRAAISLARVVMVSLARVTPTLS